MMHTLLTFVPVAALLSITPGAATALVVRNAARGGRRHAFFTTSGNRCSPCSSRGPGGRSSTAAGEGGSSG